MTDVELRPGNYVAGEISSLGVDRLRAIDPTAGTPFGPSFVVANGEEIDRAVAAAADAAQGFGRNHEKRADFLNEIAGQLEARKPSIVACAGTETALPSARLEGELGRTVFQLRAFAKVVQEGDWLDVCIDLRPADIRRMMVPVGPVAVFGASNFPLAFSVAGGDTASAFAAGCPVVAKAHPSHPGTSALAGEAIFRAAERCGLNPGVFSMLHGGVEVGQTLCVHPKLDAVTFTGSLGGGRALYDLCAKRQRPIPVFAEMGSTNPVFVLPGALADGTEAFANGYVASLTLGVGQFCTNPGLLIGIGSAFEALLESIESKLSQVSQGTMLNPSIQAAYGSGVARRANELCESYSEGNPTPRLFRTSSSRFLGSPTLQEELFGPSAVAVGCGSFDEMLRVAKDLAGQLTATVHAAKSDEAEAQTLLQELSAKAGRLVCNGFPTGVEVCPAMQHGGPYPATTDSRFTSVGAAAIRRFLRPVAFQNLTQPLLPAELRDDNSKGILRRVDGVLTRDPISAG